MNYVRRHRLEQRLRYNNVLASGSFEKQAAFSLISKAIPTVTRAVSSFLRRGGSAPKSLSKVVKAPTPRYQPPAGTSTSAGTKVDRLPPPSARSKAQELFSPVELQGAPTPSQIRKINQIRPPASSQRSARAIDTGANPFNPNVPLTRLPTIKNPTYTKDFLQTMARRRAKSKKGLADHGLILQGKIYKPTKAPYRKRRPTAEGHTEPINPPARELVDPSTLKDRKLSWPLPWQQVAPKSVGSRLEKIQRVADAWVAQRKAGVAAKSKTYNQFWRHNLRVKDPKAPGKGFTQAQLKKWELEGVPEQATPTQMRAFNAYKNTPPDQRKALRAMENAPTSPDVLSRTLPG